MVTLVTRSWLDHQVCRPPLETYGRLAAAICETAADMYVYINLGGRQPVLAASRSLLGETPEWLLLEPGQDRRAGPLPLRRPAREVSEVLIISCASIAPYSFLVGLHSKPPLFNFFLSGHGFSSKWFFGL